MKTFILFAVCVALLTLGCSRAEKYELGQSIEMGPFTFSVQSAWVVTGSGHPRVDVDLRVMSDSGVGFEFADYFNDMVDSEGNKNKSMRITPHVHVVDTHRHSFVGLVKHETGEFVIWELKLRDQEKFEEEHSNMDVKDFRIMIRNPDPQRGQPRAVSVQLK